MDAGQHGVAEAGVLMHRFMTRSGSSRHLPRWSIAVVLIVLS